MRAPGFGHRRIQHLGDIAAFCGGTVIAEEAGLSLDDVTPRALRHGTPRHRHRRRLHLHRRRRHRPRPSRAAGAAAGRAGARGARPRRRDPPGAHRATVGQPRRDPRGRADRGRPKERFRRTEGALAATQAAMSEGVVPAAAPRCCARRRAGRAQLEGDYARGAEIIRNVLSEPLYWIASNAGYDGQATIDQVRAMPDGHGLNALTGEFGDLFEKGVIDPVRVTRLSLEHAASVAALLLTTEAIVAEELIAQPGAIIAPGFGDLAEGMARPSSPI